MDLKKLNSKYIDEIYHFKGLWDSPSLCGLKIIRKEDKTYVIATELYDKNPGTSIINFCTQLATCFCKEKDIEPNQLVFIQHTPDTGSRLSFNDESFSKLNIEWNGEIFINPKWQDISYEEVEKFISD